MGAGWLGSEIQRTDDPRLTFKIQLDHRSQVLTAQIHVASIGREVGVVHAGAGRQRQREAQRHRVRVAKVQALEQLRHGDGIATVRCEIQVVGIGNRDRATAGFAGCRIDRLQAVANVARDVEGLQVIGGHDVLWARLHLEVPDDAQRLLVDHIDRAAQAVGHIHERGIATHHRAEVGRRVSGVDVVRIHERWHGLHHDAGRRVQFPVRDPRGKPAANLCGDRRRRAADRRHGRRRRVHLRGARPAWPLAAVVFLR